MIMSQKHPLLSKLFISLILAFFGVSCSPRSKAQTVSKEHLVSGIAELMEASTESGRTIRLKPGIYQMTDFIPLSSIPDRRERKEYPFLVFSGNDNIYQLEGVIIELDTALRAALRPPVHTNEIIIAGSGNTFNGLEIRCIGNGTSPGGALVSIQGPGNTLVDCTFHVQGSYPYAYGDLFGKGGPDVLGHHKHSGIQIVASHTTLIGCHLRMRSFGHGYFIQKDAHHIRFENCTVEGEMRSTDDMLAETEGPAFKVDFRTISRNRDGQTRVTPGYIKSLAEDGFRTYSQNRDVVFKNCTAIHMRSAFELRTKGGVTMENCKSIGCERGFWVSDNARLTDCQGDARYGPLLFVEGNNAVIEMQLLPDQSDRKVHALASIHGTGNQVTFKPAGQENRTQALPILIGYGTPSAGEGMSPIPERLARGTVLHNETSMPVEIGALAENSTITSRGPLLKDSGKATVMKTLPDP
jgi:hypothetical protein